jgi:hypothetical protein
LRNCGREGRKEEGREGGKGASVSRSRNEMMLVLPKEDEKEGKGK